MLFHSATHYTILNVVTLYLQPTATSDIHLPSQAKRHITFFPIFISWEWPATGIIYLNAAYPPFLLPLLHARSLLCWFIVNIIVNQCYVCKTLLHSNLLEKRNFIVVFHCLNNSEVEAIYHVVNANSTYSEHVGLKFEHQYEWRAALLNIWDGIQTICAYLASDELLTSRIIDRLLLLS